ncbi:MAG: ribosome maturation factor RimP [Lachnospiraceae bacterium]|nr:ribosome maturation factor RimP [Lachnospiraceae bacterium]
MSKRDEIEKKTEAFLAPITQAAGVEIYDVEYVKEGSEMYLRAYIDKPGGVTVGDCETVSRAMNEVLDREDYIEDAYTFEVSSPGLGRVLKKDRHLAKSIGEDVEIKLYKAKDGVKELAGSLKAFDADTITIENETGEVTLNRDEIAVIRLALDF